MVSGLLINDVLLDEAVKEKGRSEKERKQKKSTKEDDPDVGGVPTRYAPIAIKQSIVAVVESKNGQ